MDFIIKKFEEKRS